MQGALKKILLRQRFSVVIYFVRVATRVVGRWKGFSSFFSSSLWVDSGDNQRRGRKFACERVEIGGVCRMFKARALDPTISAPD